MPSSCSPSASPLPPSRRHPHLGTIEVRRTDQGHGHGVAIRSTGGLELAPTFKALYTTPSTYIWSIASDDAGNIYAAAGAPARVYRITPDGQATTIFEPTELQVQALVVDKNGVVYAGTAPDGKVYKIEQKSGEKPIGQDRLAKANAPDKSKGQVDPNWTSSVYFDPGTKYIWDLALDGAGNLYVATGDHGEIYRGHSQRRAFRFLQERRSPHPRAGARSDRAI